jgi:hypothetical protein
MTDLSRFKAAAAVYRSRSKVVLPHSRPCGNTRDALAKPGAALVWTLRPCGDLFRVPMAKATWRSGYAADCKSVYAGSIPAVASNFR